MKKIFSFALTTLLLAGCVPSWNALYTTNDLTFDPVLVGSWKDDEGKEKWLFQKVSDKAYRLTHTDSESKTAKFDAHLLKIQNRLFLDLYLTDIENGLQCNSLAQAMLVPAHLFLRVDAIGNSLKMAAINPNALKERLEADPKAIAHRKIGTDQIVLTAETKELQAFVLKHAEGESLFGGPFELTKIK